MTMAFPETLKTTLASKPRDEAETCGYCFLKEDGWVCVEVDNVHPDPKNYYQFSPEDIDEFTSLKHPKFVWHTHINGERHLTLDDVKSADDLEYNVLMFNVRNSSWDYYTPNIDRVKLMGREWKSSHQNCYTLVQDYYRRFLGIELPKFYLDMDEYSKPDWNGFLPNMKDSGFYRVQKRWRMKQHDLLLFSIGSKNPNHIGVLSRPTELKFMHHLRGKLSCEDELSLPLLKRLHSVWRYKDED